MESSFKRDVGNYPLYFLLWTAAGLFYFSQGLTQRLVSHDTTPWWHYLAAWLLGVYVWALLTPAILWLGRAFPLARSGWLRRAALHALFSACFSAFELTVESALYSRLHLFPGDFRRTLLQLLALGFHGGILDYWIVLAAQWGVLHYRDYQERSRQVLEFALRASELQSRLVGAQLSALKMQLQPHFLFNTLNAITVLVRQQRSKDAERMLGHIGDLLRGVLEDVDTQEVSLRRELEYLQLYLSIERVRFADRLRVEIAADPASQAASVPHLILQPIVENAIRHGIGKSSSAGRILISTATVNGTVRIRVADDGPGFSPSHSRDHEGIGLANTRARLRQLYGEEAQLEIENCSGGGAAVTLRFPFRDAHCEVMSAHADLHADRR